MYPTHLTQKLIRDYRLEINQKKKTIDFFTAINKRVPKVHVLRDEERAALAQTPSRKGRRKTRGERRRGRNQSLAADSKFEFVYPAARFL